MILMRGFFFTYEYFYYCTEIMRNTIEILFDFSLKAIFMFVLHLQPKQKRLRSLFQGLREVWGEEALALHVLSLLKK